MSASSSASPDLRRLLLDAAREILREPDTPLDLRKVAERAGKSRTAPYLVFGKEADGGGVTALRIAVAADGAEELSRRMEAAAGVSDDPLEAFRTVAETVLAFSEENPRLFHLMFGTGLEAISGIGEEVLLVHEEFRHLLEGRDRAGEVVSALIVRGQERGLLSPDVDDAGEARLEVPSMRYLQIAWATTLGMAVLREDEILRAVRWEIDRPLGARLVTEAVFGVDPGVVEKAWHSLRKASASASRSASRSALASGSGVGEPVEPYSPDAPREDTPRSGRPGDRGAEEKERSGDWMPGMLRDLVGLRNPAAAAREILKRLERERGDRGPDDEDGRALREALKHDAGGPRAGEAGGGDRARKVGAAPGGADTRAGSEARGGSGIRGASQTRGGSHPPGGPGASDPSSPLADRSTLLFAEAPLSPRGAHTPAAPSLSDVLRDHSGLRRAAYDVRRFRGAPLLWIDDHPEWNEAETALLRQLGFHVVASRSTEDALRRLRRQTESSLGPFRVILSDIARGSRRTAGVEALPRLREVAPDTPVIFYVGEMTSDRVPPKGSAGITDSPDQLLHLVLDALERG